MDSWNMHSVLPNIDAKGLIFSICILSVLSLASSTAVSWYRLSHVPGPLLASITSLWIYHAVRSMDFNRVVKQVQGKYGKIVRISPNDVLVSDPETLWRINSARSTYSRAAWYASTRFNPYGDSVFSELDTAKHDKRKAKLIFGFSGKGLMDIEGNIDTQIAVLVDVLRRRIEQGQGQAIVDIGRILQHFQVDLITFAGMGQAWGNLPLNKDHFDYLATGDELFPFVHSVSMLPLLSHIFFSPLFLRFFGPSTKDGWLGALRQSVEQRVNGDKAENDGGDMLVGDLYYLDSINHWSRTNDLKGEWLKHGLSPAEAELDLSAQVPAGTETSITTIRSILMFLMTCPVVYQKLKEEIANGIRHGAISSPVTNEEAKKLPYLQAVINEGLRMAPPFTAAFPKKVPAGGDIICGKPLPAGTGVYMNISSLMSDRDVFGQDVELFRPERFIDCDEATQAKRLKVVDLNFGHGRWLCVGKTLAWTEINKIFVELLRSFDFQVLNPERPWCRTSTLLWYIKDFNARVTENPLF